MEEQVFSTVTSDAAVEESAPEEAALPLEAEAEAGTEATDTLVEQEEAPDAYRRKAEEWEKRFKGLQGRLQQEIEARRALELERAKLEAQLQQMLIESHLAQLPEEERPQAAAQLQAALAYQAQVAQVNQTQQVLNELAKHLVVQTLSQRYGVPQEQLLRFNDPYAMEAFAQEISRLRRQGQRAQRRESRSDAFESGGGAPPREPKTLDEAAELLKRRFRGR
jgi:membrane-associated HD superfamily phosphohydrolase